MYKKTRGLLGAGLFYAILCILAGHPLIPCMFHTITGLYCPGCGVSRMCLSLLSLDFQSAFQANAAVMLILPPGLIIAFQMAFRYIKKRQAAAHKGPEPGPLHHGRFPPPIRHTAQSSCICMAQSVSRVPALTCGHFLCML